MLEFARSLCTSLQLPARLRELAILALAGETNATFVWTQHVPISAREGIGEDLTDAERSVLRFTAAVANGATVPDDVFTEIRAQLSAREIVELLQVLVLGYYAMLGRISTVLDIEPSELYDGYRDSFLD
ncbi:hypothetical protein AB0F91_38250 [Amycolatopsis sp. NPDC023774]|uniref:carboxymuconolactone decarboxylase family protein n=1 Tax=Amycolatopsis sp. NPDC023774 TaxID=3155015 RepID=UPI0033D42BDD